MPSVRHKVLEVEVVCYPSRISVTFPHYDQHLSIFIPRHKRVKSAYERWGEGKSDLAAASFLSSMY